MPTVSKNAARVASWLGLIGQLCTLPFYSASGLLAPAWAIAVLLLVWLALLATAVWAVRANSAWGLLVPFVSVGLWFALISAGEAFLHWKG
ncbi:hypothetical protein Aph01nite_55100 [Acrocarpospora phusangensis]|uniref:Uncharacterized protein n=1 Tax=Acrocarpospora phusangensis TaxID=1070424 RepID=A0A919UT84_9ACTN|nr:hypothetical protein [Acrocarpospora phusangensis]GIH27200.1 hypothetical protein Aph01nite_55100 [Acrocarpospora phusangensis]